MVSYFTSSLSSPRHLGTGRTLLGSHGGGGKWCPGICLANFGALELLTQVRDLISWLAGTLADE
jgi:hypothetical protein